MNADERRGNQRTSVVISGRVCEMHVQGPAVTCPTGARSPIMRVPENSSVRTKSCAETPAAYPLRHVYVWTTHPAESPAVQRTDRATHDRDGAGHRRAERP